MLVVEIAYEKLQHVSLFHNKCIILSQFEFSRWFIYSIFLLVLNKPKENVEKFTIFIHSLFTSRTGLFDLHFSKREYIKFLSTWKDKKYLWAQLSASVPGKFKASNNLWINLQWRESFENMFTNDIWSLITLQFYNASFHLKVLYFWNI